MVSLSAWKSIPALLTRVMTTVMIPQPAWTSTRPEPVTPVSALLRPTRLLEGFVKMPMVVPVPRARLPETCLHRAWTLSHLTLATTATVLLATVSLPERAVILMIVK